MDAHYHKNYFETIRSASVSSAGVVAPLLVDLLQPQSVVDVGCGDGSWLAAFQDAGVQRIVGVDGAYVDPEILAIPRNAFRAADLTRPLKMEDRFDLAICLEVAEHLPADAADVLVETLTALAPVVLFSAAIPHQGGEQHLNEQWPDYWIDRFSEHSFRPVDGLRHHLWLDSRVEWWYAQNILLFGDRVGLEKLSSVGRAADPRRVLPLVHPGNYKRLAWRNRVLRAAVDLATFVPPGSRLLLADDCQFGTLPLDGRDIVPFTEQAGIYGGPPSDATAATEELDRQMGRGAQYLAFGWPAFWQLEAFVPFAQLLREKHQLLLQNERVILYRLEP